MVRASSLRGLGLPYFVTLLITAFVTASAAAQQQPALTVVNRGPEGVINDLAQANEIRIVFSEPMVTLGRIPSPVTAPFVRIAPAIPGSFRWSGTTILIFTPDPKRPLPYATTYQVTVDTTATSVSGRRLARARRFSSPRRRSSLLSTYVVAQRDRRRPMVGTVRFNQPVSARSMSPAT